MDKEKEKKRFDPCESVKIRGGLELSRDADNQRAPAGEFAFRNLRHELQVRTLQLEKAAGGVIEEVDYVAAEAVLEAAAFFEGERAHGIYLQVAIFAQDCAQLALEFESALPNLRHGECNHVIGHISRRAGP